MCKRCTTLLFSSPCMHHDFLPWLPMFLQKSQISKSLFFPIKKASTSMEEHVCKLNICKGNLMGIESHTWRGKGSFVSVGRDSPFSCERISVWSKAKTTSCNVQYKFVVQSGSVKCLLSLLRVMNPYWDLGKSSSNSL